MCKIPLNPLIQKKIDEGKSIFDMEEENNIVIKQYK